MGIFTNLFKMGRKPNPISSGPSLKINDGLQYAKWSKEQLIERLVELESEKTIDGTADTNTNNKRRKSEEEPASKKKKRNKKKNSVKPFDFSRHHTRFIALRFAYLGWKYNGLALQKEPTALPTVEETILEVMNKCKLVPSMEPLDYNFSRCGRTDKGVSAMNQVISLTVRSNLSPEEQRDPANDHQELQYVHMINHLLPDDIRVSAVCLRPPADFDARHSCKHRHYRYLFKAEQLDLEKMREAAKLYEGEHDFRNFCKIDGSKQITNYRRRIISGDIIRVNEDFYCFDLVGTAFLWHQVRCMMACLFLVGQGLEKPSIVTDLMNIDLMPQKPLYDMASDVPLLLYDCKFPDMEWIKCNLHDYKAIKYGKAANALALDYQLKASMSAIYQQTLPSSNVDMQGKIRVNIGDGQGPDCQPL
ncbi:pseudouridine synthase DEG1 KNAG_0D02400 [Huiozyma naganishii CBS 8797]|uniref:Pseudouridine synthase I TruA alpha/beta domain-containing protein n=1 Tax=Huiozyma naganishii (strain ATCC MYA-139 / BCRC 22969 / CBS 8797 / KCTC 17520 / NBRC 10181 / NCYC 3082 / Yp74L-3) TaxID=1071383 RepID=J7R588_HUIN7|nr:hypothetical protein KNAG_0D02400 [Kazachstania naganishii CBS 8797]CCK69990.1 hypothetical protein KNAG_0D02400 [Kazachstania naganishii CBS 8797]